MSMNRLSLIVVHVTNEKGVFNQWGGWLVGLVVLVLASGCGYG